MSECDRNVVLASLTLVSVHLKYFRSIYSTVLPSRLQLVEINAIWIAQRPRNERKNTHRRKVSDCVNRAMSAVFYVLFLFYSKGWGPSMEAREGCFSPSGETKKEG
jgi:hypothetical protein